MFEKLKLLKNQYEQLCARMEMPETYADPALYSRYERGFQTIPLEHLIRLADLYHVSLDYLTGRTSRE